MNRADILKVIVLLSVIILILDIVPSQNLLNLFSGTLNSNQQNITGNVLFNGTIRTYEPVLGIISNSTDVGLIADLQKIEGVHSVSNERDLIVINVETRDDVLPVANALKERNLLIFARANVVPPPTIYLDSSAGKGRINVTATNSIIQVDLPPVIGPDNEIAVSMIGVASQGRLVAYSSAQIIVEPINISINGTVTGLDSQISAYRIPWQNRSIITNETLRLDIILFKGSLTVPQIIEKKQLPYITFIEPNSAKIAANFSDKEKLISDFPEVNITFPDSSLKVSSRNNNNNSSLSSSLALSFFDHSTNYIYNITLPAQLNDRQITNRHLKLERPNSLDLNSTISLNLTGLVIGSKIVVTSVS